MGRPRGSVDEFRFDTTAVALRISTQEVERTYLALEKIGWIEQQFLTTWDEEQPDNEDPTAKERSRRYRAHRKDRLKQQLADTRVTRDDRDATPDSDSDLRKKEATVTELRPGDLVESWDRAEAWKEVVPVV